MRPFIFIFLRSRFYKTIRKTRLQEKNYYLNLFFTEWVFFSQDEFFLQNETFLQGGFFLQNEFFYRTKFFQTGREYFFAKKVCSEK